MTIIRRYSENSELLAEDKQVDTDNLEQYIAQYGEEYARGYFQALTDFEKEIEGILWKEKGSIATGTARVHTALKNLYSHKLELLKRFESLGVKLPLGVAPQNPMQD